MPPWAQIIRAVPYTVVGYRYRWIVLRVICGVWCEELMYDSGEKWGIDSKTDKRAQLRVRGVAMFGGNAIYFVVLYHFIGNL